MTLATVTVASVSDLPDCGDTNEGEVRYVAERERLYACTDGEWRAVPLRGLHVTFNWRGPQGPRGDDGLRSLIRTVALDSSSSECQGVGGVRIETGVDHDQDGELDADEVQQPSAAVCHGRAPDVGSGTNGHNALVLTSMEPPGDNCEYGGVRVDSGTDLNDDGELDSTGMTDLLLPPSFICNATGVQISPEPPGEHCQHGGQRLEVGVDLDGDGVFGFGEVVGTTYHCDGMRYTAIAAGDNHTCALVTDGSVRCWGLNTGGSLGRKTPAQSFAPVSVRFLDDAIAIAAGGNHNCAIRSNRTAVCWGPSDINPDQQNEIPTSVDEVRNGVHRVLTDVIAISTSGDHSCVVLEGGRVRCWGRNTYGQIGDGTTEDRRYPVPVMIADSSGNLTELTGARRVAAGVRHTCAIVEDGLYCWGYNGEGQLGTHDTQSSLLPRRVREQGSGYLFEVEKVTAGWDQTCADVHGRVRCWGNNQYGAVGELDEERMEDGFSSIPVIVFGHWGGPLAGPQSLSAGLRATCTVAAEHGGSNVYCWGSNEHGQLGVGDTDSRSKATPVIGFDEAMSVTAGGRHACALPKSGRPLCWGDNAHGQLGNGSFDSSDVAVEVVLQ